MWKSAVKVSLADHAAGAGSASTAYYCAASAPMGACRPGLQGNPVRSAWLSLHILRRRSRTYQGLQHGQGWTRLLHSSFRNGQGCAYLIWQSFRPIIEFQMAALSLVSGGDFPCLSRQLDSMQAKKGPGGPFSVLASPFIAEPALPE